MNIINDKIKLVIWDLDETFWRGTLSEEGIEYISEHHDIVIELASRGIVSSICSKNNHDDVKQVLIEKKLWDYFVFAEIDWLPKGQLVKKIINDMGLRAVNVLFIDDNLGNLNEVSYFNEGISICEPLIIKELLSSEYLKGKNDSALSRLEQYKILEQKRLEQTNFHSNNDDFLKDCDIKVLINNDVLPEIDRILELVERTNQLNYTKYRCSKNDLINDISDPLTACGYVFVQDRFGSYGISGFYLIKNNILVHFLFSCRSMNMGIESWLYKFLGEPMLNVIGDVAITLDVNKDYSYIKQCDEPSTNKSVAIDSGITRKDDKILLVGGCDLDQVVHYLSYPNISTDFNYVNSKGLNVHKEHTSLICQFCFGSVDYDELISQIPILDVTNKKYKLFENDWAYLVYSPLNDYSRGIYKHRGTGFLLPFDSFNINWCEESNWNELPNHLLNLPKEFLINLRDNYDFLGAISPSDFKDNISLIADHFKSRKIVLLSGSECQLSNVNPWETGMESRHVEMNKALFELALKENVTIIDVNELISSSADHLDNIRHYKKNIYLEIAKKIATAFNDDSEDKVRIKSKLLTDSKLFINKIYRAIKRRLRS